jgi:hypothetical protein
VLQAKAVQDLPLSVLLKLEESSVLGCDAVSLREYFQTFRKVTHIQGQVIHKENLFLFELRDSDDEGITILRNVGNFSPNDTASHPRRLGYSATQL